MKKNSIFNVTQDKKEILKKILENMIKSRPRGEVVLHPYYNPGKIISKRYAGGPLKVNFKEIFINAEENDFAYFKTNIYTNEEHTVAVTVKGFADVYYKDELILQNREEKNKTVDVDIKEGENELLIKVYCKNGIFGFEMSVSPPPFPGMWSNDYLMWNRITSPVPEFAQEEGFIVSPLYKAGEQKKWDGKERVYPPKEKGDSKVDFTALYGLKEGKYAIALTYCKKDGIFKIDNAENNIIYVNTNKAENGCRVQKNDKITIVSKCENNIWGFNSYSNDILSLNNVKTKRKYAHWLLLGYFDNDENKDNISFEKPYKNSEGKRTFWRFQQEDTYLRPYLDTCFFGKWYYALMVGHYGILNASRIMGEEYSDYFKESISILARYYDYMDYEKELFPEPTFLSKSWYLDNLDSIGSIGMNLCELYKITKDEQIMDVLKILIESAEKNIPRFDDGTFYRHAITWCDDTKKHIMWADDVYMSCPFLVRFGEITGDEKYYREAVNQLIGFFKRLYMEDEMLLSHVYFVDDDKIGGVAWGRGNGWMFYTMADILEKLPGNFEGRENLLSLYNKLLEGIVKNIDKDGMWHQVLNCHESYKETSCSAMFIAAIAKGIKNGWILREKYMPLVLKAWEGLLKNAVDEDGCIYGVCKGSGCHWDKEYYMNLATVVNDDHGTGIIMTALCELIEIEKGD